MSTVQRRDAVEISRFAKIGAPIAAFVATTVVRRILESRYKKVTGDPVPAPEDLRVTFRRALVWSVVTAFVTTAIQTSVVRAVDRAGAKQPVDPGPSSSS